MTVSTISPQELDALCRQGEVKEIIDVCTALEFRELHAETARNIPLDTLDAESLVARQCDCSDRPLHLMCRSGTRGRMACEKLIAAGVTNVVNVEGGLRAWEEAGLAVVRGKKTVSLERQVRITAGVLVVLGALLGIVVHPYWAALSAFVGAGLVLAGVTDSCPMALLLARMPWNRIACQKTTCCQPAS